MLPRPTRAVDGHAAAVRLGDVLDDRQAEARAAEVAAAGLVDAVEPLEEPRQVLARMPGPWSPTLITTSSSASRHGHLDGAALGLYLMALSTRLTTACSRSGGFTAASTQLVARDVDGDVLGLRLGLADLDGGLQHIADVGLLERQSAARRRAARASRARAGRR